MRLVTTAKVQILLRVNFLMYKMQSARKPPWLMGFYSELCWHLNLTFSGFKWTPFSASSFHGLLCHMSDPGGLWSTLRPLTSCFSPLSTICSETRPLHSGAKFFLTPHVSARCHGSRSSPRDIVPTSAVCNIWWVHHQHNFIYITCLKDTTGHRIGV